MQERQEFDPWVRKIPWRRKWQPTPVLLPGESRARRTLAGCSPWGRKRLGHDLAAEQRQEQGMCTGGWEGERQGGHIQLRAIDDYVVHGH